MRIDVAAELLAAAGRLAERSALKGPPWIAGPPSIRGGVELLEQMMRGR
ncbi:MAG TPA: hypothetical protein VMW52_10570 [Phycisphaerae bacterium]|nr:hypothetical protein [Phycisphaerae bacterium]